MNVIEAIEREQLKQDLPDFRVGDTVRVHVKV
ncbi:MAG: 50S ribosomal protein L19, partial [Limnochordia bacterium]